MNDPRSKAVVIEDHALMGDLLAELCRREFGYEVAANETRGRPGLAAVRRHRPHLVLLDLSLPDMDGLEIAETILGELPAVRVLALSSLRDLRTLNRVRALGIHGFFDKRQQAMPLLREAIRSVAGGRGYFSPVVAAAADTLRHDPRAYHRILSDYEQTVLGLIGAAMDDAEIAAALGIRPSTVQSRRRDIMGKLDIHTTPKLIRYAIENGFARPEHFAPMPAAGA